MSIFSKNKSYAPAIIVGALVVALVAFTFCYEYFSNRNRYADVDDAVIEVHFLDVGQGDCAFIKCGDKTMLIDAGDTSTQITVERYLKARGVERLDIIVATHPHKDHIGGMANILKKFDFGEIMMPRVVFDSPVYLDLLEVIDDMGKTVTKAAAGDVFTLGEAEVKVLAPAGTDYEEMNDYSVVLKISIGGRSYLFTGDAEKTSESEMVAAYGDGLRCDVLKVGHHGSDKSSSKEFIVAARPTYAVISVGKNNSYNHPSPATIKTLAKVGAGVFLTYEKGNTVFYQKPSGELIYRTEK